MSYSIRQLQSAIFVSSISAGTKLEIASAIGGEIDEFRGIDPVLIPLPDNAPAELPQIVMSNEELELQFQYAPSRVDLIWNFKSPSLVDELSSKLVQTNSLTTEVWSLFQSRFEAKSKRLGLVATFIAEVESAASVIATAYFKGSQGKGSSEAQMHYLHKSHEAGLSINRWVRLTGQPMSEEGADALILLIDVNTDPKDPIPSVDEEGIHDFIAIAEKMINESLLAHRLDA